MDNDLIRRSALLKDLEYDPAKRAIVQPKSTFGIILSAPAVDAVEVVRCKDCIYYEKYPDYANECGNYAAMLHVYDDGFCSYGERRRDGT